MSNDKEDAKVNEVVSDTDELNKDAENIERNEKSVPVKRNKINLSGDNGEDDSNELFFNDDPAPMEYAPPFPWDKLVIGGVVAIIAVLVVIIVIKSAIESVSNNVLQENTQEMTEDTSNSFYSITDNGNDISASIASDYSDVVIKNYNSITCWGDEYLAGALTNDLSIPTYIARNINGRYSVFNAGCYNEDINGIAERQGGVYLEVMPAVIPPDPVEVPLQIKNMYGEDCNVHISIDRNGGLNPVYINGIEGTLTATGHGYTFKRTNPGKEIIINHPMRISTKGSIDRMNDIQVIFIGKQQSYDVNRMINTYKAMVNYINPLVKSYVIVGIAEGTEASLKELEDRMKVEFGRHYINIREYLSKYAMTELSITPTEEERAEMAEGRIPSSLFDENHIFKSETNELVANFIIERLHELNIL